MGKTTASNRALTSWFLLVWIAKLSISLHRSVAHSIITVAPPATTAQFLTTRTAANRSQDPKQFDAVAMPLINSIMGAGPPRQFLGADVTQQPMNWPERDGLEDETRAGAVGTSTRLLQSSRPTPATEVRRSKWWNRPASPPAPSPATSLKRGTLHSRLRPISLSTVIIGICYAAAAALLTFAVLSLVFVIVIRRNQRLPALLLPGSRPSDALPPQAGVKRAACMLACLAPCCRLKSFFTPYDTSSELPTLNDSIRSQNVRPDEKAVGPVPLHAVDKSVDLCYSPSRGTSGRSVGFNSAYPPHHVMAVHDNVDVELDWRCLALGLASRDSPTGSPRPSDN
mmetsp:Transcript_14141/g.30383  ORF Transcript_14141/g.30383 Transcript_14141/m.30383 type:complete len:340 (-) Transcript_14141:217-1236(-)